MFLNRHANGSVGWVDVQSKPIKSLTTGNTIAVREAVAETSHVVLSNLTLERRLLLIAESLIRVGFGRARIYTFDTAGTNANLRAAAAWTDDPHNPKSEYFESIRSLNLEIDACPYALDAHENRIGSFVAEWKLDGPSPLADRIDLQPPYFDVPIYRDDGMLHSWLSADFVGMDTDLRKKAIAHYARKESLTWLREEYGREIRLADDTEGKPGYREKFQIARRARFGIANAKSVDGAINEISIAFRDLLPQCRASVRMKREYELQEFRRLSWGSHGPETIPDLALDDSGSLAVAVVNHPIPKWISNYPEYARNARKRGTPVGYLPAATQSTAQIPLKLENIVLGTLSISSPTTINWEEEGYKQPLSALAKDIALVLRDLALQEEIDRAMDERAAMIAYSVSVSADGLWRHWAQQRLSQVSAIIGIIRTELANGTLENSELDRNLIELSGVVTRIQTAQLANDAPPSCSTEAVFSRLKEIYALQRPVPTFSADGTYDLKVPEFILRDILMILLDNALRAIQTSSRTGGVTLSTRLSEAFLAIDVADDGPGISEEMQLRIFRGFVRSEKGQGLGLLYARGAALNYGGDLTFASRPGATRFTLKLPLTPKWQG